MDYGALLSKAWDIVWNNKWLVILGFLVMLGSGGSGGGSGGGGGTSNFNTSGFPGSGEYNPDEFNPEGYPEGYPEDFNFDDNPVFDFEQQMDDFNFEDFIPFLAVGSAILIPLICLAIIIGLLLFAVSQIAQGGLVYGVDAIDAGQTVKLAEAWQAGWAKAWRLIGIGIIPALPGLVLGFAIVIVAIAIGASFAAAEEALAAAGVGLIVVMCVLICIVVVVSMVLGALATFAYRAAMLEDLVVFDAYRRGWDVITANIGPVIILFVLQLVIGIVLGILLILPSIVAVICCVLLPILWAVQAGITTYFSTVWTLAYREWTRRGSLVDAAPAV